MYPEEQSLKRKIKRIGAIQLGKILGILYGMMGLIFIPFILIGTLFGSQSNAQNFGPMAVGLGFAFIMPILYAVVGFIGGVIVALLYNLIAKFVGGIEIELE